MFEQAVSGFEIYESIGQEFIGEEIYQTIGGPARRKLEVREIMILCCTSTLTLKRPSRSRTDLRNKLRKLLVYAFGQLANTTGELRNMAVEQLKQTLS